MTHDKLPSSKTMTLDVPRCYICYMAEEDSPEVELRPYGPKGKWLCFDCMMANSEREKAAKQQFYSQLESCGTVSVIGESTGPRPLKPEKNS